MIGLFLGDTDFSELVLKKIKKQKIKYFIIDFSKNNKFNKDKNSFRTSIGRFGKIIDLIKQKKCKTNLHFDASNKDLLALIKRAENWLKENTFKNPILKWETKAWGEIPADFGRK